MSSTFQLKLLPEDRQQSFGRAEELIAFLAQENQIWDHAKVRSLASRFGNFRNEIQSQLSQARGDAGRLAQGCENVIRNYENRTNSDPLIYSATAAGEALRGIGEKFGQPAGDHAYYVFAGTRRGFDFNDPNALIGVVAAALFKGASVDGRADAELAAATNSRSQIETLRLEIEKIAENNRADLAEILVTHEAAKVALSNLESSSKESLESTLRLMMDTNADSLKSWEKGFLDLTQGAQQQMGELNKLYETHLQLAEPVKHWKTLEEDYDRRGRKWLERGTATTALFIAFLCALLYLPPEIFNQGLNKVEGVRALILLALVVSVAVYLIRLFFKLSLSAYHLSRDARERAQLTYFYLALLKANEKSINTDERKIVFQALFSRADTGLLNSDGPSMPGGSIDAIIGNLKGK